jgi:hypothetical protein
MLAEAVRMSTTSATTQSVLADLASYGFLLVQDPELPSVATLVAGDVVKGSWWGHKKSHEIFRTLEELDDVDEVLVCKLVARKTTLVHRRIWPALIAIARSRETWQLDGLSQDAQRLFDEVERASSSVRAADGTSAKELEQRLLVRSRQVHTERGTHATELSSWRAFVAIAFASDAAARAAFTKFERDVDAARREIEHALDHVLSGARSRLPWMTAKATKKSQTRTAKRAR